jgi:DNA transformation protein
MAVSSDFLTLVLEQLGGLAGVTSQRMFGGVGLYCDELFFGLIADDVLYLRADDANRADYTARGMSPFRPYADRPQLSMKYYETPAEVLEDPSELVAWAQRSLEAARAAGPPAPGAPRGASPAAKRKTRAPRTRSGTRRRL